MTRLHDAARAYAAANPTRPPTRTSGTWNQLCGVLMYQFGASLGWSPAPHVTGPGAIDVSRASGTLNGDSAAAPVGAFHFWAIGTYGHVGMDLDGGGSTVFMATSAVRESWGSSLGINSVSGYSTAKGARYLGWSTNYGGGHPNIPADPPPDPTVRRTVPAGVNVRPAPTTQAAKGIPIKGNFDVKMDGFAHGENVAGSDIWFHHAAGWSHESGFTSAATTALPDETPAPPVVVVVAPPVVTPPVVTDPPPVDPPAEDPPVVDPPVTPQPPTDNPPASDPPASDPPATDPPATVPPKTSKGGLISAIAVLVGLIVGAIVAVWPW